MESTSKTYTSCMMPLSARDFFINVRQDMEGHFYGTISQVFYEFDVSFYGLDEAVLKIDNMLNEIGCVQASTELRDFREKDYMTKSYSKMKKKERIEREKKRNTHIKYRNIEEIKKREQGQVNYFVVEIMYRQHSSWQGNIMWRNDTKNPKKKYFRIVLELMTLIRSAYEKEQEIEYNAGIL